MKVGLIGRGAVGTMYASLMHKTLGKERFFIVVDGLRKQRYETTPFTCNGELCDFHYVSDVNETGKLDLIFIVCKYPSLKATLQTIQPFVKEDTILVCLLNGVISEQVVEQELQKGIVIHSIAQLMDALMNEEGVVYTQSGEIVLGVIDPTRQKAMHTVASFLQSCGISYKISEDIIHDQWSKLMLNCGLNQVCMVYDVPYRECSKGGKYRQLFIDVMKETMLVAKAEGILLTDEEIEMWKQAVDKLSPTSMPSMRQDRLAKRYSEVDLFSKTMIELAKKHGLQVPLNEQLYKQVLEIEKTY